MQAAVPAGESSIGEQHAQHGGGQGRAQYAAGIPRDRGSGGETGGARDIKRKPRRLCLHDRKRRQAHGDVGDAELAAMIALARKGIAELSELQTQAVGGAS